MKKVFLFFGAMGTIMLLVSSFIASMSGIFCALTVMTDPKYNPDNRWLSGPGGLLPGP